MDTIDEAKEREPGEGGERRPRSQRPGGKPFAGKDRVKRAGEGRPRAGFGKPGGKPAGPGAAGKPAARPLGKPIAAKPLGKPLAQQPLGKPTAAKPLDKPVAKLTPRPLGKPAGKPTGPALDRPAGRPAPAARPVRPVRRPAPAAAAPALPAPTLDPLSAAKLAWRRALTWCEKEQKNTQLTDPKVLAAIQGFQARLQAILAAPDAETFRAAQAEAVNLVRDHQFLRWAPLPRPLPTPE